MAAVLRTRCLRKKEEEKKKRTWYPPDSAAPFEVDVKYAPCSVLGRGAFGVVCSCINLETNKNVAIKKISDALRNPAMTLREMQILRRIGPHDNIVSLKDVMLSPSSKDTFRDVYLVQELMSCDLGSLIKHSHGKLTGDHVKYFMFQILTGLNFLHSANVIHRDIKPRNILVDKASRVKICDFGLARTKREDPQNMSRCVGTSWYKAPELLTGATWYGNAVDIWAAGCVLAEMLSGSPIFPMDEVHDRITRMYEVLGTPSDLNFVESETSKKYLESLPYSPGKDFRLLYPEADPHALDLLKMMLVVDPSDRASASQALQHPYFEGLYDPDRDAGLSRKVKVNLEVDEYPESQGLDEKMVRELSWEEMMFYHPDEKNVS